MASYGYCTAVAQRAPVRPAMLGEVPSALAEVDSVAGAEVGQPLLFRSVLAGCARGGWPSPRRPQSQLEVCFLPGLRRALASDFAETLHSIPLLPAHFCQQPFG